jgi:hypothetical protein
MHFLARCDKGLLNNVRWIDAGPHPRVHPGMDHLRESPAVTREDLVHRRSIAPRDATQKFVGIVFRARHDRCSPPYNLRKPSGF